MGSYDGHSLPVRDLTFTSTGDQLITASEDSRIKVSSFDLPLQWVKSKCTECGASFVVAQQIDRVKLLTVCSLCAQTTSVLILFAVFYEFELMNT